MSSVEVMETPVQERDGSWFVPAPTEVNRFQRASGFRSYASAKHYQNNAVFKIMQDRAHPKGS
ncbi:hypothetical protein BH11PLA2_BH11PLA2_04240 [soil metagenome]